MKTILLLLVFTMQVALAQTIAYTSFEEPATGGKYTDTGDAAVDHALVNNSGEASVNYVSTGGELGFTSYYYNTEDGSGLTDGDYVGVTDYTNTVGSFTDGSKGFQMSDTDGLMVTTLDTVDISAYASVQISVDYFINDDTWETSPMDYVHIWLVLDGKDSLDMLNTYGSDIDDLGIEGMWRTAVTQVSGYSKVNVKLALQSNGSFEAVYFDNIQILEGGSINIPPVVSESGVSSRVPQATEDFVDTVKAFDESAISKVELHYAVNGGSETTVAMTDLGRDSLFAGTIPASAYNDNDRVAYWVVAEDDGGATTTTDTLGFFAGTTPLNQLKQQDANQALIYSGYYARTSGVATVANGVFDPTNLTVYIQDGTYSAINIFRYDAGTREIIPSHSYTVVGQLSQFNGLAQITPDDAFSDIVDNGEATMPEPAKLDIATLLSGPESFEGLLVEVDNLNKISGDWPAEGVNANLTVSDDGDAHELTLRIDKDTDIDGTTEPTWPKNVVGIFGQYDYSSPFTEGYQLLPRSLADFADTTAIGVLPPFTPQSLKLHQAYPNPFNPSTTISFEMPANLLASVRVELAIYNSLGQKIKTLLTSARSGWNETSWDGTADNGQTMATGIYYAVLRVGAQQQTVKLMLMK